jgi:hypothetical protein
LIIKLADFHACNLNVICDYIVICIIFDCLHSSCVSGLPRFLDILTHLNRQPHCRTGYLRSRMAPRGSQAVGALAAQSSDNLQPVGTPLAIPVNVSNEDTVTPRVDAMEQMMATMAKTMATLNGSMATLSGSMAALVDRSNPVVPLASPSVGLTEVIASPPALAEVATGVAPYPSVAPGVACAPEAPTEGTAAGVAPPPTSDPRVEDPPEVLTDDHGIFDSYRQPVPVSGEKRGVAHRTITSLPGEMSDGQKRAGERAGVYINGTLRETFSTSLQPLYENNVKQRALTKHHIWNILDKREQVQKAAPTKARSEAAFTLNGTANIEMIANALTATIVQSSSISPEHASNLLDQVHLLVLLSEQGRERLDSLVVDNMLMAKMATQSQIPLFRELQERHIRGTEEAQEVELFTGGATFGIMTDGRDLQEKARVKAAAYAFGGHQFKVPKVEPDPLYVAPPNRPGAPRPAGPQPNK